MSEQNGGAVHPLPVEPLPDDVEDVVDYIRRHALHDVKASLYENRAGGMQYLHTFAAVDEVNVDAIREQFGGGHYQVRFRRGGTWLKQPTLRIAGPQQRRDDSQAAPPQQPGLDPRLEATLSAINRTLEQLASKQANPSADLVGLATAMATAQAPLLAAIADAKRPNTDMTAMMDVMLKAMEFARESSGGGGGYSDVLNGLGRPLMDFITRGGAPAAGALPPAPGDLSRPVSQPNPPPAPLAGSAPGWYTALQPLLPQLLQLAAIHGDVDWWAERIVSQAEEPTIVWMTAELDRRDAFEAEFYRWVPDAVTHREWFDAFWDAIAGELAEEPETEGGAS